MRKRICTALFLALVLLLTACGQSVSGGNRNPASETGEPDAAETDAPSLPQDVENNGGYYVRLDGKVYFRRYGPEALEKTAVFGQFTEGYNMTGQESEISAYNLTTCQVETMFPESGYGPLYYCDGGWYLQERVNGRDEVVRYTNTFPISCTI